MTWRGNIRQHAEIPNFVTYLLMMSCNPNYFSS